MVFSRACLFLCALAPSLVRADDMDRYAITWNTPAQDEADSVPLGNGNTAINLWVEKDGDLVFYLARNDAMSELHRLMKLGRVRVHLSPNPFSSGKPFSQTLDVKSGICTIRAGGSAIKVFVDSDSETVYLSGTSSVPMVVSASLENWRNQKRTLGPEELASTWAYYGGIPDNRPDIKRWESPDTIVPTPDAVTWYHRNAYSLVPTDVAEQHLSGSASVIPDPIVNRTFGASISGSGFRATSSSVLGSSQPRKTWEIRVSTRSEQVRSASTFLSGLKNQAEKSSPSVAAQKRTSAWWNQFWNRSWVFVDEGKYLALPSNKHAVRFGADSGKGSLFRGDVGRISVLDHPISATECARLAHTTPTEEVALPGKLGTFALKDNGAYREAPNSAAWQLQKGFTMEAWIKSDGSNARIFDKVTAGIDNGLLFDIYNGSLRLICGGDHLESTTQLPKGEWVHVTATGDPATGTLTIYQNGKSVAVLKHQSTGSATSQVTQSYILTRYQLACQQRSAFPAHFNGGTFTVAPEFAYYATDPRGRNWGPDYRFYGSYLWWQNTRFLYQLHIAEGNYDLTDSFFNFYFNRMPVFEALAKTYYKADGIFMNETVGLTGLPSTSNFGWDSPVYNEPYTRTIWQQALEFGSLALDRWEYTEDRAFLNKTVTWCDKALRFYDTRFAKNAQGIMVINPTHAVETYWNGVTNDMPSIAGLMEITSRLLALPSNLTTADQRARWQRIAKAIPAMPKRANPDGTIVPEVAEKFDPERSNYEAPDLYSVYPFRIYGLNRTQHNIDEAKLAWKNMVVPGHYCWYQTGVFAARLGLTQGAQDDVLFRTSEAVRLGVSNTTPTRRFRFPGFNGSPHDWCPDYDGAGNMANTLQEMILQPAPGNKLLLFPAWPKEWSVRFKLHAPGQTIVEGRYAKGKVTELKVTPASRKKDLVVMGG